MPTKAQYRKALKRLLRSFQGDWPTISVAIDSTPVTWVRLPVDDETRDAVVHARKLVRRSHSTEAEPWT